MNKKFTVLVGLLVAVVVTSYSVCGTYAKYTEDFSGESSEAAIATWDVEVNETDGDGTFEFNLLEGLKTNKSLKDPASELLAPGSKGSFLITITNNSDVKVKVDVNNFVLEGIENSPLQFSATDGNYGDLEDLEIEKTINGDEGKIRIYWQWPFEVDADTNNADTALGKAAAAGDDTLYVTANVTVSQVSAE